MGRRRKNRLETKKCKYCGEVAPHNTAMQRGALKPVGRCVACEAARKKTNRDSNIEDECAEARERERKWRNSEKGKAYLEKKKEDPRLKEYYNNYDKSPKGKARTVRSNKNRTESGKGAASRAVTRAIRDGLLVRPTKCQWCKDEPGKAANDKSLIEAHHFLGYDKEHHLHVEWLCKKCHGLTQAKERQMYTVAEAKESFVDHLWALILYFASESDIDNKEDLIAEFDALIYSILFDIDGRSTSFLPIYLSGNGNYDFEKERYWPLANLSGDLHWLFHKRRPKKDEDEKEVA